MGPFGRACNRVGAGLLGTWCVTGVLLFTFGLDEVTRDFNIFLLLLIFVVAFYVVLIWKCRQYGLGYLKMGWYQYGRHDRICGCHGPSWWGICCVNRNRYL